jgi:uncharacterized protein
MPEKRLKEVKMKKGIILTLSLIFAAVLFTAAFLGCNSGNPAGTNSPEGAPQPVPALSSPSGVEVFINNQIEGIWVNGTGKVAISPDIAILRLGIEAQELTVAEALANSSAAMKKVMTALADGGVMEKDLQTQNFRIRQRTRWDEYQEQDVVIGYRVTNDIVARIRDMEKIGDIIDAVVAAGGDYTRIDDLNFSVDDPSAYYNEARETAMADAKDKAEKIADLAGMKLGVATYLSESTVSSVYEKFMVGGSAPMPVPTPTPAAEVSISTGELEIIVNMQVAYTIVEKAA